MLSIRQKLKIYLLAAFTLCGMSVPLLLSQPALAATGGMCLVTSIQGNPVNPPTSASCSELFNGSNKDAAGVAYDASKCYTVYQHNGASFIDAPVSCSDSRFGTAGCPTGYLGTPPNCSLPSSSLGGNCMNIDNCDLMSKYGYPLINFLAALVGVAVTISIIVGGIQYGSSAGDPQAAAAAKARIRNAIIALVTFIFLYALLNFLMPGGIFKT